MWFKYVPADLYGRGLHSILVAFKVRQTPKLIALAFVRHPSRDKNEQTSQQKAHENMLFLSC